MGRKIITKLNEFIMSEPATKPAPVETPTKPKETPVRPGRPVPRRTPRPEEEEKPMATNFDGVMGNIKNSLVKERGTKIAMNLVKRLKELSYLPQSMEM